jgi:SAM-dependent methyltransferase
MTIKKIALNVGCGTSQKENTHYLIQGEDWEHVRVDIDPEVNPDIIDDSSKLEKFPPNSVDAIFSSHNLEHLHEEDAKLALSTYYNRLKPGGICIIVVPNLRDACKHIAEGREDAVYLSPAGPIRALDMIYGFAPYTRNNVYQRHLWGYTSKSLHALFLEAGFENVQANGDDAYNVWAFGQKYS